MSRNHYRRTFAVMLVCLASAGACLVSGCATTDDLAKLTGQDTAKPVINAVTPTTGKVGAIVQIAGVHFGTVQGAVAFQDPNATFVNAPATSWTDTLITVTVPQIPSGTGAVNVGLQTSTGQVPALPGAFTITP